MGASRRKAWKSFLGATYAPNATQFRVWAPSRHHVEVELHEEAKRVPLQRDLQGYFVGSIPRLHSGTLYRYRLDKQESYPDPASRFQPQGPHGPSMVVDPRSYPWSDHRWKGIQIKGQVIYELHIGTFTREGTFDAARRQLTRLKALGITTIEIMPIHEWAGRWNWGYDGVGLYAPAHVYGDPDELKKFVNHAHALGMGVVLDVVYNHMGPEGCYLNQFSAHYFSTKYKTDWGQAINFDGRHSVPVRRFFTENASYWISEFHLDGLRLDATQNIYDSGTPHVLADISRLARRAAGGRHIILIAENEPQDTRCLTSASRGGFSLDGMWSDDFHHAARVALTGKHEAYYSDFRGTAQELISVVKRGFIYQGQRSGWQNNPRGSSTQGTHATSYIFYLQNHDQIANSLKGDRLTTVTTSAHYRAITALHLLIPETPMLFMGQEYGETSPFMYFSDLKEELHDAIRKGRRRFLKQFPSYATSHAQKKIPDPTAESTFWRSKHKGIQSPRQRSILALYRDLLALRATDPVLLQSDFGTLDGAVLAPSAFVIRFFGKGENDRLLLINLGAAFSLFLSEPLLAPPSGRNWQLLWHSEKKAYGGSGKKPYLLTGKELFPAQSTYFYGTTAS